MSDRIAKRIFIGSAVLLVFGLVLTLGIFLGVRRLPPVPQINALQGTVSSLFSNEDEEFFESKTGTAKGAPIKTAQPGKVMPGLVMVAGQIKPRLTEIKIIDRNGDVIHKWTPIWKDIWPDGEGTFYQRPAESTYLHGVRLLDDGSVVANFDDQSTFRMDLCGNIIWKLDNLGNHSVTVAPDQSVWVPVDQWYTKGRPPIPNIKPVYQGYALQHISEDGKILGTYPIEKILKDNGLDGLVYATSPRAAYPSVTGDALHMNSIVRFPDDMKPGFFKPGDLLVSIRNIQTMVVLRGPDMKVIWQSTGQVVRQHDSEFLDGNTISIFDNDPITPLGKGAKPESKIVDIDAKTHKVTNVLDASNAQEPFYSEIMGTHARLPNGNILVVPADEGRVIEFTPNGRVAWQYENRIGNGKNGRMQNAEVLPTSMDKQFFEKGTAACQK